MDAQTQKLITDLSDKVTSLENQLESIKKLFDSLKVSSELPFEIDRALEGRKFIKATGGDSNFNFLTIYSPDYAYLSANDAGTYLGIPTGFIQIIGGDADGLLIPVYLKPRTF